MHLLEVRWDEGAENETDKFFNKYNANQELKRSVQELLSFILKSVGEDHGAIDALFNRFENEVIGLPNKGKVNVGGIVFLYPNFPLRLYALKISEGLVILFNGGIKSAQTNQDSKDLNLKWIEACRFAKRIEDALRSNEMTIDTKRRKFISVFGDDEIVL